MNTKWLNVAGLVLDLIGVVLLFRYGMPYRVRTGGELLSLKTNVVNTEVVRIECLYDVLGWIGLACIAIGTLLQIWAALRQSPSRG